MSYVRFPVSLDPSVLVASVKAGQDMKVAVILVTRITARKVTLQIDKDEITIEFNSYISVKLFRFPVFWLEQHQY